MICVFEFAAALFSSFLYNLLMGLLLKLFEALLVMSGKGKGKVAGPAPVKLLDGIPVGEHRDRLISAIVTHVTHCDNFSPCISWTEHKKANRVNELWNILKDPWGLPECKDTKKWFNETARNRWSDFKNRKLKPFFDSAYPDLAKAIANRPERFIDAVTWEKLCKQFASISDSGTNPDGMSKSEKCSHARKSNKMNHSLGRTSLDNWKDNHIEAFGKPPSVAQLFDKAYMHIDPLKQLGSSTIDEEEGERSQSDNIVYHDDRRVISENLHRYYDEAIKAGSDESTANTQIVLKVFGRKRLRIECSGPSMQRSRRFSSSSSAELEVLKEEVAAEKKKREEIEHTLGSLLNILRQNGLMLLDESTDHHIETSVQHTESNEEQMD